jgi:hypothetical protein
MGPFNGLPPWNKRDDDPSNDEEKWKVHPSRATTKALYNKWDEVVMMLRGIMDSMDLSKIDPKEKHFPKEYWEENNAILLGDAFNIGAKLKGANAADIYMVYMENASIIRQNAMSIYSSLLTLKIEGIVDANYINILRATIDEFREIFKKWVTTFQKDEYDDEWGLY